MLHVFWPLLWAFKYDVLPRHYYTLRHFSGRWALIIQPTPYTHLRLSGVSWDEGKSMIQGLACIYSRSKDIAQGRRCVIPFCGRGFVSKQSIFKAVTAINKAPKYGGPATPFRRKIYSRRSQMKFDLTLIVTSWSCTICKTFVSVYRQGSLELTFRRLLIYRFVGGVETKQHPIRFYCWQRPRELET